MHPCSGKETPMLRGLKQEQEFYLESVIQSKIRPDLIYSVAGLNEKMEAMQSQVAEKSRDRELGFDESDYEILYPVMLVACGTLIILEAMERMNEINWPI
jgi:hypothetical protein